MEFASTTIQFLGAAGTVTGSKYLIRALGKTILVDCGLFQGLKQLRQLNWQPLPISGHEIDLVLLTHGHLDHCGYLPRLIHDGFVGKILGTELSLAVSKVILEDSARIQEEDTLRANREKFSKHNPAQPLYTVEDVEQTLAHFSAQPLDQWINLFDQISLRFRYNGHIIGATFIELKIVGKVFVFSGDIGRTDDPLLYPPQRPERADILLIESTYGSRIHPKNGEQQLAQAINDSIRVGGTVIIPSFAVERTQLLMYVLWQLQMANKIPQVPLYMDSPMAKHVLDLFRNNTDWHKLSASDYKQITDQIRYVQRIEETIKLVKQKTPKIVIAASGMASGGRVLSYLQYHVGNSANTILLVGYQAEGTRGRQLLDGASEIKIHGKILPVKARIVNIEGLSAHADQQELIDWMSKLENKPEHIFITHGEKEGAQALRARIEQVYHWEARIPSLYQIATID